MDNFQIETAQNISITQNAAGVGERILAFIIDVVIQVFYLIIINYLLQGIDMDGRQQWVYILVMGLPIFLYALLWETFWNGQTPGKAILQIRVVKIDGSKPAFSNYVVRWLLRLVDITFTSGSVAVVTILLNGKGQRLGDLAASTTVISEKPNTDLHKSLLVDLPEDYVPKYPQVTVLSDRDVENIKNIYRDSVRNANHRVINSLSTKVSGLLEVTPEEMPLQFIKTVLKDYSFYTQR